MDTRPPRDNLVRAQTGTFELLAADAAGGMPTMAGHFAVFNQWTVIESMWEGEFLERIAPGAFKKTFRENRDAIRVTFNHGHDPSLGDKVLGPIDVLEEDDIGARYEVPLLDTSYNRDLLPGLEAGLYGSSFRFRVLKEEIEDAPKPSDENPKGLPQRTIREAHVFEFGPVTYPAYAGATAGVRSLTDEYLMETLAADPLRLQRLLERMSHGDALSRTGAGDAPHSEAGSRAKPTAQPPTPRFRNTDDWLSHLVRTSSPTARSI